MTKDYSMYLYYKGSDTFPNAKAEFFGSLERAFEKTYEGTPENKETAFKDYMSDVLYEKASDIYMFGIPNVNTREKYREFLKYYFNPDLSMDAVKK